MNEKLKKNWFVIVIAVFMLGFIIYYISTNLSNNTTKKIKTKTVDGETILYSFNKEDYKATTFYEENKDEHALDAVIIALEKAVVNEAVEVTDEINNIANQYVSGYKQKADPNQILKELRRFGYNDIKELKDYIVFQLQLDVLATNYLKNHLEDIVKPFIENDKGMKISHILVKIADVKKETGEDGKEKFILNPSEVEKEKLNTVINELKTKEFSEVATKFSDDPSSAQLGGSLGYNNDKTLSKYVPEFAATVNKLDFDEVSEVVETQFGYHIIKKEKINPDEAVENNTFKSALFGSGILNQFDIIVDKANELNITIEDKDLLDKFNSLTNIKLKGAQEWRK